MEDFKSQYMSEFRVDENEDLLYYIALIYEYRCEMFDRNMLLSRGYDLKFIGDRVYLPTSELIRFGNSNARVEKEWVNHTLRKLGKRHDDYKKHISKVNRLTYDGLTREYKNIPKEIFKRIEGLMK